MQAAITSKAGTTTFSLSGHFTFNDNEQFRVLLNDIRSEQPDTLIIELSGLDYIDSSALGMLLLLREAMQAEQIALELHGARDQVQKMFEISKFDLLFTLG